MYIPRELLVQILASLPVRSLCRFKCVSKEWRFLISHPRFSKMLPTRTRFLVSGLLDLFSVNLETVSKEETVIPALNLDFPGGRRDEYISLMCVGTCSGLLAIKNHVEEFFVYNPTIQNCEKLPSFGASESRSGRSFLYGIGYADSIVDYKFVWIACPGNTVYVYSLRKRSWTSIKTDLYFPREFYNKVGVSLNGALHWALWNCGGSYVIATFDLVEEKFKILIPPDELKFLTRKANIRALRMKNPVQLSLGVLKGRLCVTFVTSKADGRCFWVMEEYGVEESWTKVQLPPRFLNLKPLCDLTNFETLLLVWGYCGSLTHVKDFAFQLYKDEDEDDYLSIARAFLNLKNQLIEFDAHVYVESLVPVNFNTEDPAYRDWSWF